MSKNLHKVQKQIAKKRGGKSNTLNENSRDAKRIQRAGMREEKLARQLAVREKGNEAHLERVRFFQDGAETMTEGVDDEYMRQCPEEFAASMKQAHTALKESRRPGRPPHPREDKIYQAGLAVDSEWTSGFWMPDLRDTENLVRLQEWDGRWGSLATIRFVRVHKEGGEITKSSFPPKGLS